MIRPLHRWKSFWLGLFVLVFLGWAWARSTTALSQVLWPTGTSTAVVIGQFGSRVVLASGESGMTLPPGLQFNNVFVDYGDDIFPPSAGFLRRPKGIFVAHWFLILLFLVPWFGWLAWRWRRHRILTKMEPKE